MTLPNLTTLGSVCYGKKYGNPTEMQALRTPTLRRQVPKPLLRSTRTVTMTPEDDEDDGIELEDLGQPADWYDDDVEWETL